MAQEATVQTQTKVVAAVAVVEAAVSSYRSDHQHSERQSLLEAEEPLEQAEQHPQRAAQAAQELLQHSQFNTQ